MSIYGIFSSQQDDSLGIVNNPRRGYLKSIRIPKPPGLTQTGTNTQDNTNTWTPINATSDGVLFSISIATDEAVMVECYVTGHREISPVAGGDRDSDVASYKMFASYQVNGSLASVPGNDGLVGQSSLEVVLEDNANWSFTCVENGTQLDFTVDSSNSMGTNVIWQGGYRVLNRFSFA